MTATTLAPALSDRERSCVSKLYWPSALLARNWAFLLNLAYPEDSVSGRPLQPYPCRHCDGFHVGHRP
jgi:hypothetical protein